MFGDFRRLTGNVNVTQKNNIITVEGIGAQGIERDIRKHWGTSKISQNMFTKINRNSLSFYSFFAPDVVYLLDNVVKYRYKWTDAKTLMKIKNAIIENTWLKKTLEEVKGRLDFSLLKNMHYTPLPFQMDFLNYYDKQVPKYNLRGALLNGAPGSGKTSISLTLSELLKCDIMVVVCPKNAVYTVWEHSVHTLFKEKRQAWVADSGKPYRGEKYLIVHYEALEKLQEYLVALSHKKVFITLDESHNVNEIKSMRTQLFIDLCKKLNCQDILWASGTPLKALGSETIPLFRTIDPFFTEEVEESFKKIFGSQATTGLDILNNRLGFTSFVIEKKELNLLDPVIEAIKIKIPNADEYTLPEIKNKMKSFIEERYRFYKQSEGNDIRELKIILNIFANGLKSNEQKKAYEYYRQNLDLIRNTGVRQLSDIKEELMFCNNYEKNVILKAIPQIHKERFKHLKTLYKYMTLKIQGECLGRVLGRLRIQCHIDMVEHVDFETIINHSTKKTLVFTSFVEVLEKAKEHLTHLKLKPLTVYGKTNDELANTVKVFEYDKDADPLVATFQSLSTAVPLVMADTVVMLNAPFRDYIMNQAISRVHRLGQDSQVYIYTIELDTGEVPNISGRSFDILKWSQEQVAAMLGIPAAYTLGQAEEDVEGSISTESYDFYSDIEINNIKHYKNPVMNW